MEQGVHAAALAPNDIAQATPKDGRHAHPPRSTRSVRRIRATGVDALQRPFRGFLCPQGGDRAGREEGP